MIVLAVSFGCSSEPGENDGGEHDQEYLDDAGDCRRPLEAGIFGCAESYEAALVAPSRCGAACAGPAGDQSLFIAQCTPSVGCAYDRQTGELVGATFGDDVPSHCGDHYSVVSGQFPAVPEFNGFDLDESCAHFAQRNLSSVLDEALRHGVLPAPGMACRGGHDECRGPVTALVCANPRGQIIPDGVCSHCVSDSECRSEYRYADTAVTCGRGGHCVFGGELAGECPGYGSGCFTAEEAYVCVDGLCGACTENDQCSASGPYNLCLGSVCMRSEPRP
ncbi:MAG TPA: hypothetical protein VER11_05310 [Polyangiaceae bacterium]|nr:hypothetical protein [Polyangiaceae bacterium]